jgi:hypothetical protein
MKDMLNKELHTGDTIAVSFIRGKTPCLRVGTITAFVMKEDWRGNMAEQLRVMWSFGWNLPDSGESVIENRENRIVKL